MQEMQEMSEYTVKGLPQFLGDSNPDQITPRLQASVEALAARQNPTGEVTYKVCARCGNAEWVTSLLSAARKVNVKLNNGSCPRCSDVRQRNPELFDWVMDVFAFQSVQPELDNK